MGFIKAFTGALGGTFADQWQDFYMPRQDVPATAALFQAVPQGQNAGRGENTKGSENIISNGSKIVVPEGTALITIQDGAITGMIAEPGGFIFKSDDPNSQSMFAGDGIFGQTLKQTWEKVKFGGQPGSQQLAFYVNLKEIPNNRFGTQSEIYWDDAYFQTQVGAVTRGTYTLKIVDPLLFIKNFVPSQYLQPGAPVFDFADMDNAAGEQLFNEVVGTLSAAFSNYTNDPSKGNRISKIQGDQIGFAQAMAQAVEDAYQWKTTRGLEIVKTAILAIEYDEDTKELMKDVKKADALSGARGNSFMQQAAARGMQAAGENGGGASMAFMGMGMNAAGGMMGGMQQPATPSSYQPAFGQPQQAAPAQPAAQTQPPKKNKKGLVIIALLIVVGLVAAVLYFNNQDKKEPTNNETPNNSEVGNNETQNNDTQNNETPNNTTGTVEKGTNTTYDENGAFLFSIEDVFTITGRGTVVSGRVERGTLKIGDSVQIVGLSEEILTTEVTGIEMFRVQKDTATVGDNAGILLKGITREQVQRGQVLAKPNSIIAATKFDADVHILSKEEDGRHTPFFDNYIPQFYFRTTDITGTIDLPDNIEMVSPGEDVSFTVTLESNVAMEVGNEFSIREGGRTVGTGTITKVY